MPKWCATCQGRITLLRAGKRSKGWERPEVWVHLTGGPDLDSLGSGPDSPYVPDGTPGHQAEPGGKNPEPKTAAKGKKTAGRRRDIVMPEPGQEVDDDFMNTDETPDGFPKFREPKDPNRTPWPLRPRAPIPRRRPSRSRGGDTIERWGNRTDPIQANPGRVKTVPVNRRGRTTEEQAAYEALRLVILRRNLQCMAERHAPECDGRANALQHIIPRRKPYRGPDAEWNLLPVFGGITGSAGCHAIIDTGEPGTYDGWKHESTIRTADGRPLLWLQPRPEGGWAEPPWLTAS